MTYIFAVGDPNRPQTNRERQELDHVLKFVPEAAWREYMDRVFHTQYRNDLTHAQAEELRAWAVREWAK